MTYAQARKVHSLVRKRCCNYDDVNCLLLDDGYDPCPCPQLITRSLLCKWFREAVLPDDLQAHDEILLGKNAKSCTACGKRFIPGSNRAKYCPDCARRVRREKEARRQRERYANQKSMNPEDKRTEN